jgi:hypothetical protein
MKKQRQGHYCRATGKCRAKYRHTELSGASSLVINKRLPVRQPKELPPKNDDLFTITIQDVYMYNAAFDDCIPDIVFEEIGEIGDVDELDYDLNKEVEDVELNTLLNEEVFSLEKYTDIECWMYFDDTDISTWN